MNVGELRDLLSDFDGDVPVFLSKDEEGNAFYELLDVAYEGARVSKYYGQLDFYDETDNDADPSDYDAVVVLWP